MTLPTSVGWHNWRLIQPQSYLLAHDSLFQEASHAFYNPIAGVWVIVFSASVLLVLFTNWKTGSPMAPAFRIFSVRKRIWKYKWLFKHLTQSALLAQLYKSGVELTKCCNSAWPFCIYRPRSPLCFSLPFSHPLAYWRTCGWPAREKAGREGGKRKDRRVEEVGGMQGNSGRRERQKGKGKAWQRKGQDKQHGPNGKKKSRLDSMKRKGGAEKRGQMID